MSPLTNSWMFFPGVAALRFMPTAHHAMDRLLLGSIVKERHTMQTLHPGTPEEPPPLTPARPIPTDVPVPEPFDVPVPEPMDVPPPDPRDVPPPNPIPLRESQPKKDPRPRSVP